MPTFPQPSPFPLTPHTSTSTHAVLYIVPATLGTVLATAAAKGDIQKVWHFTDVPSFGVAAAVLAEADGSSKAKE